MKGGEGFLLPLVALVVNGPGGIDFADGLGHGLMAAAVAGFVAQAPHENAGVVAVAHHHAHAAVHELGLPFRVLGDVIVVADVCNAVALDVRFIHHIQTILVAKIQEARVVGIMAGADGVHVVPLHEQHVLFHVVDGGIEAQQRMSVVAVHAQELDVFTVEVEHAVLDFDFLEAHIHPLGLTGDFGNQLIPMGRFRRPGLHVFDFSRQPRFAADHVAELREHRFFAVQQRQPHGARVPDPGGDGDFAVPVIVGQGRAGNQIGNAHFAKGQKRHVPEDARVPPHILVFQVGAVRPLQHDHAQGVFAVLQKGGNIEFCGQVRAFGKARQMAIHIDVVGGRHAFKTDNRLPTAEGSGQGEPAVIDAHRRIIRHIGRVIGNGIAHVGVLGAAIALQLPHAGYLNRAVNAIARFAGQFFHVIRGRIIGKLPFAVQPQVIR